MELELRPDGQVYDGNRRFVGYIDGDAIYSGGYAASTGGTGGTMVGYIDGDAIYSGGYAASTGGTGGTMVGYIDGDAIYSGGYAARGGGTGGQRYATAQFPHPRRQAAIQFLLT